ncbi:MULTISPECIES: hypothetical protein [unclassified Pseudofrankia]|uniref:hypothetical protein n=1 Tax=unclassified Pseudofrankia TaxID=2994372 RepID=UPI0008D8DE2A|nr:MULTISPECIES: hypothetical protein [unclassified Pseudofrankia]MDT3441563.1 hypothetical protein [Pseudofrankia sp. BMG5.37]OHV45605.1 hypothetical protein BCD48_22205 [Pseudofrankia sp. BMG5.36]
MADHDRIVPWFPDVDLDVPAAPAARAPRAPARPLGARRRPASTGHEPARAVPGGAQEPPGASLGEAGGHGPAGLAAGADLDGYAHAGDHDPAGGRAYALGGGPGDVDDDYAGLDYSLAGHGLVDVAGAGHPGPGPGGGAEGLGAGAGHAGAGGQPASGSGALLPALPRPVPAAAGPAPSHPGQPTGPAGAPGWPGDPAGQELLDPRVAARRFANLLADEDRARGEWEARLRAGHEEALALAESYRDAAAEIRGQVRRVWGQVSESLAPFGVDNLDQVRGSAPATEALPGIGLGDEGTGRRSLPPRRDGSGRRADATPARAGRHAAASGLRPTGAPAAVSGPAEDGPLDVAAEADQARRLWMRALATAAELRGVQRASSSLSIGLVTAGTCVLAGLLSAAARLFLDTDGLPCLAAGLIAGAALVSVATDGGAKAAVRSALLSAGTAGAVVLATARVAPTAPAAIILSLASLAAAVRFGLGFGASKPEQPAAGGGAGRRR